MKAIPRLLTAACLAPLLVFGLSAQGDQGPLPEFAFRGVALHPDDLAYAPAEDLIHPTIIKTEYGSKYIMLYSGFIEGRGIRCVWLAHSKDAENWIQLTTPLVEPVEGENNDAYGPALLHWKGRNFIVYQDHTTWRGGNIKYVEVDSELNPVGDKGKRFVLMDPPPDPPLNDRYRGSEFYFEDDTFYLYSSASSRPRIIVYATADAVPDNTSPDQKGGNLIEQRAEKQPPARSESTTP